MIRDQYCLHASSDARRQISKLNRKLIDYNSSPALHSRPTGSLCGLQKQRRRALPAEGASHSMSWLASGTRIRSNGDESRRRRERHGTRHVWGAAAVPMGPTTSRSDPGCQLDIASYQAGVRYHFHSRSSKALDRGGSRSWSSPAVRIRRAASAHPARRDLAAVTTNRRGSACNLTWPRRAAFSSSALRNPDDTRVADANDASRRSHAITA